MCSRDNPCVHCQDWTDITWHNQDLRVNKVRRNRVGSERKLFATPSLSKGATSTTDRSSVIRPRASPSSIRSEPAVAENPMGIPRDALDRALLLSQPRPSRPLRRVATAGDETLSLNTLCSLRGCGLFVPSHCLRSRQASVATAACISWPSRGDH